MPDSEGANRWVSYEDLPSKAEMTCATSEYRALGSSLRVPSMGLAKALLVSMNAPEACAASQSTNELLMI